MVGTSDNNHKDTIKEAVQHFVDAQLRGQRPDIDEFVRQYPGLELQIRQSIQDLEKIDSLFDSLVQADESDFEEAETGQHLIGRRVGSFEIVEMIGRGGMGVVYLAHDTKLKRSVAVKTMPAELAGDSTARMRFRREAELLASLNHPNIAVIHEIIEEEKSGYLVLEYVPGQTLAERIAREPLELEQALSIGRQVTEAVSAAHQKGIVHRDLKPGNIKITPEDRVKVLDFGLAKVPVSKEKDSDITSTEPGRVIGTPAYMSPEQARGKETDHRTDIWSFGCIMFQMLTGRLPFEGETATDILAHIIERDPDWELLPKNTPKNIRDLLHRCLDKEPDRRLGDIAEAGIEIKGALSLPSTSPQATIRTRLRTTAIIVITVSIGIILFGIALKFISPEPVGSPLKEIRLVVLPFENLGPPEKGWFAYGVTDAITTRLADIHGLGVISRQRAMQYKNSGKSARQIAEELPVDYILEGTVQYERLSDPNGPVRITTRLIRGSDDTHVWAQTYDKDMSEVFQVQSDVAEQVARALDIALSLSERQALASKPTENMEAYFFYQRGNEYYYEGFEYNDWRYPIQMYKEALNLDPTFALAWAWLSRAHVNTYWLYPDRSPERLAQGLHAAQEALRLDPELPEAHLAMGQYYYNALLDYRGAMDEFQAVLKHRPNDSEALHLMGCVQRRMGEFEKALDNIEKAAELDPRGITLGDLAETLECLRKFQKAEFVWNRNILLHPKSPALYIHKALLYLRWQGDVEKARKVVDEAIQNIRSTGPDRFVHVLVRIEIYAGNFSGALRRRLASTTPSSSSQHQFVPKALQCALICRYMKDEESAKEYFEEAREILEGKVGEDPNDARFHSSLGVVYAGLGRREDAIREGELAIELLPIDKDALIGPYRIADIAQIYTMVGEHDLAINRLEHLLSIPSRLSIPLLRLDPAWAPLRDHPRFKKLVEDGR